MGHSAMFWSKLHNCLTKKLCSNMKLLLEQEEENVKSFLEEKILFFFFKYFHVF